LALRERWMRANNTHIVAAVAALALLLVAVVLVP
jgi:hypothetical protein